MDQVKPLLDICLDNITSHLELISTSSDEGILSLQPGLRLPPAVSDGLFKRIIRPFHNVISDDGDDKYHDKYLHLFCDPATTRLSRINLSWLKINDEILHYLMKHQPIELNLLRTKGTCTLATFRNIKAYGGRLRALFLSADHMIKDEEMFDSEDYIAHMNGHNECAATYTVDCPQLQFLTMHTYMTRSGQFLLESMLQPLTGLKLLDLSECDVTKPLLQIISKMKNLTSLTLFAVTYSEHAECFELIMEMKQLRILDLSQRAEKIYKFSSPDDIMQQLIDALPDLECLDLSSTNLAGMGQDQPRTHRLQPNGKGQTTVEENYRPISFLKNRRLKFLGLLNTGYDACMRPGIPADRVTGTADEAQVIESLEIYHSRCCLLQVAMHRLFVLVKEGDIKDNIRVSLLTLRVMERHLDDLELQIIASATLYYLSKPELQSRWGRELRQCVIGRLVVAMNVYGTEAVLLRNCSLTLCNFKIPRDVLHCYSMLMSLLVRMVTPPPPEEFVQRIGVYLLNCLACQVGGREKMMAGDAGAVVAMLKLIQDKLNSNKCDEVMETAWSMLWNVTDETPANSLRFLDGNGVELFNKCLEAFKQQEDLVRNMMGLMGNIAEVKELRGQLRTPHLLNIFVNMLDSTSDGIEVSYNACGVLAHLIADRDTSWPEDAQTKTHVSHCMEYAIKNWPMKVKRNINYRSFEPIIRLLGDGEEEGSQLWATWALCNLTKMYKHKYCPLLVKEGGVEKLKLLASNPHIPASTQEYAKTVVERCERVMSNLSFYNEHDSFQSDEDETDDMMQGVDLPDQDIQVDVDVDLEVDPEDDLDVDQEED